jgi:hypothetical protein
MDFNEIGIEYRDFCGAWKRQLLKQNFQVRLKLVLKFLFDSFNLFVLTSKQCSSVDVKSINWLSS